MPITIYDKVGNPKVELSPNDSSTQVTEIQGDSVLTLSFTHYEHIDLDVDDYADFEEERYWLTEKYRPKQKSTKEWSYDIKLYGVESMIKRLLVIKTIDNEEEPVFTLTAPPREHVAMIVHCMNDGMGNITDWKVGQVDGTENIVIDYFGKYCDQALKEIAEKVGAEWWVEGQTVNICKCEHGEPVFMGYDKGLTGIEPTTADNVDFYTRLYPVGSSRNIDREKYGYSRLQLPGGQKYVEMNADKYGRVDHYEANAFADIYPRRTGVVSSVRSEVKTGEDGKPFTIYYFRDDSLPFDPNDYEIGGLVKRVSFQEGSELAGLGDEEDGTYYFEVNYNSNTREFEIITIWPYDDDTQLPGDTLVPKAGDKYILWNLRMPDEYYALAEEEFLTAVNKYNADHNLDLTVYKAATDHVWIEDNGIDLSIGRRVRLESEEYFPEFGYRDSRITRITRKVNLPSQMDIEIGDALSRTSMQRISDSVSDARSYARSIRESISLPDIIRTGDSTKPTDNNLLSAKRSFTEFLNKIKGGTVKGETTFEKAAQFVAGFISEGVTRHNGGARFGEFVQGLTGAVIDAGGNAEVESITVRSYLKVMELIYNRLNALEGDFSFSDSGTIEAIEDLGDGTFAALMRRRWDGDFTSFQEGDIIYGYVNRLDSTGEYYKAWAVVRAVDRENNMLRIQHYTDAQVPSGHNYPMAANMLVARWGNEIPPSAGTHKDFPAFILDKGNGKYVNTRQSLFLISAEEGNIRQLMGVDSPILRPGCFATVLGRIPDGLLDEKTEELINKEQPYLYARGIVVQDIIRVNYQGVIQRTGNYRGVWDAATASSATDYYAVTESAYDTVTHKGALWMCLSNATTEEPSEKTTAWRAMTAEESTHIEYRYTTAKEGTVPGVKVFVSAITGKENRNPTGWATLPPQVAEGYALWRIQADINPDDTRASAWSDPVRISGFPGKDGDDGTPGLDGRDGLMVYPAGEYDPTELYEDKNGSVPVVLYNGTYYVLSRGAQYCGDQEPDSRYDTPAKEYANSPAGTARWAPLEKFNSIFADILMANFAKLGSAVFYGDWMISQQGTLTGSDGTVTLNSTAYEHFKDGSFEPNYSVNFLTGEMRAGAGTFSGTLTTRFKPLSESDAVVMGNTVTLRNDLKLMFSNDFNGMVNIPTEPSYVGQRITLCDYRQSAYVAGSEAGVHLRVIGNGNSLIYGGRANGETSAVYACSSLAFRSGIVELIAIPDNPNVSYGQQPTVGRCRWYLLTAQADFLKYYKIGEIV